MASAVDVVEELPFDELPVEDVALDESGLSPPQPANITAPSNPTTRNRCIVHTPRLVGPKKTRQPVQDPKGGTYDSACLKRHRRQPRYLGAGEHLKTGGFASPPSSGFAFTTVPVNCFFNDPSNVAKARQRKVPRGLFRKRLQRHGEFTATACNLVFTPKNLPRIAHGFRRNSCVRTQAHRHKCIWTFASIRFSAEEYVSSAAKQCDAGAI